MQKAPDGGRPVVTRRLVLAGVLLLIGLFGFLLLPGLRLPAVVAADAGEARPAGKPEDTDTDSPEEEPELPSIDDKELPSVAQLLEGPPRDWIVLTSKKVIEVDLLQPRPGTLEALKVKIQNSLRGGLPANETEADKNKRMDLFYLPVTLIENNEVEEQQYRLHQKFIREIVYYEDLVLRRVDRLLDENEVRQAFELLLVLDQMAPEWAGLRNRHERLLWVEAGVLLQQGLAEQAFVHLEELHHRNAGYPGLMLRLGSVTDGLMTTAVASHDYRQARFFLRRLRSVQPGHAVGNRWANRLQQLAEAHLQAATSAEHRGEPRSAAEEIRQAAKIWPDLSQLAATYSRITTQYQQLSVGVQTLPAETRTAWPANAADRRQNQLLQVRLFEPVAVVDKIARYRSRWLEEWEPTDLGHSIVFRLRAPEPGSTETPFTSGRLLELLSRRLQTADPRYDDRFSNTVSGLTIRSPLELVVEFRQPPLRPESLFSFPLEPAPESSDPESPDRENAGQAPADSSRSMLHEIRSVYLTADRQADQVTYRRRSTVGGPRIVEIVEHLYPGPKEALTGLIRGEVSLLPRVPPWQIRELEKRPEFNLQPYAVPTTHVLQFHPQNPALQNRTLRRALMYALDREHLLVEHFLHEAPGRSGRLTSAPFPTTSYAYENLVKPHGHDAVLGAALAIAARKELGELPRLRLIHPDDPQIAQAVAAIVADWQRIGIDCESISAVAQPTRPADTTWDIAYRSFQMAEPLVELWPFLTVTGATDVDSLEFLPGWLRQELLLLDRAGDWATAEQTLYRLHRQLWAEVHLIPLWELSETMVWRKHVRGIPTRPVGMFQQMEDWSVEPWYSPE